MIFKKYSDKFSLTINNWSIRFDRGKHWVKPELHWHCYLLPSIEVEYDYDWYYVRLRWLYFTYLIEILKLH